MAVVRLLVVLALAASAGCASTQSSSALRMQAADEQAAASLLGAYLMARGWAVRLAGASAVEAMRDGVRLRLEPLLDAAGVDRIVLVRHWPAAGDAEPSELEAFATELNSSLNVGLFSVAEGGLELESSLFFLEELDARLLDGFLAFTADVDFAVQRVQGERRLLAPVETSSVSR